MTDRPGTVGKADELLAACRSGIRRVAPAAASQMGQEGALLVDIRPVAQRASFGGVPGALVIERNVLEWRLDPTGSYRHPDAGPPERPIVIFCQEGYASGFAVESLQRMGLVAVYDMDGGFEAWAAEGLAVIDS